MGSEYAPDEVGVALHLARGTACARVGLACRLLATLPETHTLWESGRIDTAKARAIDDATWMLSPELARAVQDRVLPRAPEQTLAQLKAALARAVIVVDPDGAEQRHRQARRDRRVVITPEADGMASLWALLTATQAAGAFTWLTRLARGLGPDDPRSMDTRRADILAALLSGQLVTNPDTGTTPDSTTPADPTEDDESTGDTPIRDAAAGKPTEGTSHTGDAGADSAGTDDAGTDDAGTDDAGTDNPPADGGSTGAGAGRPIQGTGTPPEHTITAPNHPGRLRARHPHRHATTPVWTRPRSDLLGSPWPVAM